MANCTVSGTLHGYPNQVATFELVTPETVASSYVAANTLYTANTDGSGLFSISLPRPDSGEALYRTRRQTGRYEYFVVRADDATLDYNQAVHYREDAEARPGPAGTAGAAGATGAIGPAGPQSGLGAPWIAGRWYDQASCAAILSDGSGGPASGRLSASLMLFPEEYTLAEVGMFVSSEGGGAAERVGLYSVGDDGLPDALVVDFGEIDTSLPGECVVATTQVVPAGWYWVAHITKNAASSFITYNTLAQYNMYGATALNGQTKPTCIFTSGVTYGALPATFPTPISGTAAYVLQVGFKRS